MPTSCTFIHLEVDGDAITLTPGSEGIRLTRQPRQGKPRWVASLPGQCQLLHRAGDTLVVATSEQTHRAVGLDLASGRRRWLYTPK